MLELTAASLYIVPLNLLRCCWPLLCAIFIVANFVLRCLVFGAPSYCNYLPDTPWHQLTLVFSATPDLGSHRKVLEVDSLRILPICSSFELQLQIDPPPSWRYLGCHGELLLIDLHGCNLRIVFLILVFFLQRTLGCKWPILPHLKHFILETSFFRLCCPYWPFDARAAFSSSSSLGFDPLLLLLLSSLTLAKSLLSSSCFRVAHISWQLDNAAFPRILWTMTCHSSET